jgi:hypothetical protein
LKRVDSPDPVNHGMKAPVVELVGPAGSGKSTLRARLIDRDDGEFCSVSLRESLRAIALITAVRATAVPFLTQARRMPTRPFYRFKLMVQLHAHGRNLRRLCAGHSAIVYDQGPVYLLSILQRALRADGADSYAFRRYWEATLEGWANALDLIVVLDAPDAELYERIQRRGSRHRLLKRSVGEAARSFERGRRSRAAVLAALATRNSGLRILQVPSAADSAEGIARAVAAEVERLRAPRPLIRPAP